MTTEIASQIKTMSSLEIAELTGKLHKNIIRDIRKMIETLEAAKEAGSNLSWHCETASYVDAQGKAREMYRLDKNTTTTLLSGYDIVARHKIVQRWQELEADKVAQSATALPLTPMELLLQSLQTSVEVAKQMVETERRVSNLEERFGQFQQIQQEATAELQALPAPSEEMPELSTEDKVRRMVNVYASATVTPVPDVWRKIYTEMYYRYRVSVNHCKPNPGESKLQMLKRLGHVDKLWVVATNILQLNQPA
ncbi:hypothetical protein DYU11_20170 [Fibrisoma montanum]|uniref:Rha family transcriptional regulator n=1 Tax=Fibrisoma montanum TaxID=2305895 RepID=A0A418M3P4_9BACT|nr:Rha family transcriptional regulator [Fibrisoma montanum]RIV20370.1 hypothetical protein DYU11_20170 [Fibrisoma montanum]